MPHSVALEGCTFGLFVFSSYHSVCSWAASHRKDGTHHHLAKKKRGVKCAFLCPCLPAVLCLGWEGLHCALCRNTGMLLGNPHSFAIDPDSPVSCCRSEHLSIESFSWLQLNQLKCNSEKSEIYSAAHPMTLGSNGGLATCLPLQLQ